MLSKIRISDFIYIKSMSISTKSLIIKAVGIVVDDNIEEKGHLGKGVTVDWLWNGKKKFQSQPKCIKIMYLIKLFMKNTCLKSKG